MKTNMGGLDRTLRVLIAIGIAVLYYIGAISGTLALVLGVVALVFLITSAIGFCPLYTLFRLSTKKTVPGTPA